jgi:hypothetical protein
MLLCDHDCNDMHNRVNWERIAEYGFMLQDVTDGVTNMQGIKERNTIVTMWNSEHPLRYLLRYYVKESRTKADFSFILPRLGSTINSLPRTGIIPCTDRPTRQYLRSPCLE